VFLVLASTCLSGWPIRLNWWGRLFLKGKVSIPEQQAAAPQAT